MKVFSPGKPQAPASWIIQLDSRDIIEYMSNGSRFVHKRFKYPRANNGDDLIAEFVSDAIIYFRDSQNDIAKNPRVIMSIEYPHPVEKPELSLELEQILSVLDIMVYHCDASVIWGLAVSGSPFYTVDIIVELSKS